MHRIHTVAGRIMIRGLDRWLDRHEEIPADPFRAGHLATAADALVCGNAAGEVVAPCESIFSLLVFLVQRRDVLFHGSQCADIKTLELRRPGPQHRFRRPGVYATSSVTTAFHMALTDRRWRQSVPDLCRFATYRSGYRPGRIYTYFSLRHDAEPSRVLGPGCVYIVPREPFLRVLGRSRLARLTGQGITRTDAVNYVAHAAVNPLARLMVTPEDLPRLSYHLAGEPFLTTLVRYRRRARSLSWNRLEAGGVGREIV